MVILDSVMNTFVDDDINLIPNNFSYEYFVLFLELIFCQF